METLVENWEAIAGLIGAAVIAFGIIARKLTKNKTDDKIADALDEVIKIIPKEAPDALKKDK